MGGNSVPIRSNRAFPALPIGIDGANPAQIPASVVRVEESGARCGTGPCTTKTRCKERYTKTAVRNQHRWEQTRLKQNKPTAGSSGLINRSVLYRKVSDRLGDAVPNAPLNGSSKMVSECEPE